LCESESRLLEVYCPHCGVINRSDRAFCLRCKRRLFPLTKLDLELDDFVYPGDRTNLSVIEEAGWLPAFVAAQRIRGKEVALREHLSRSAQRVENLSLLDAKMRTCGDRLGLARLPEAYVVTSPMANAAVMGTERSPIFMITAAALQLMTEKELEMLVAHELAHIKSRHMLYHTAAESIAAGGSIVASLLGMGMVAYPLQISLLAWHRESEITADRAALLLGRGDVKVFTSMLTKTLLYNGGEGSGSVLSELFLTHPEHQRRIALAREFCSSPEYARSRDKLDRREKRAGENAPNCTSCGAPRQPRANFCGRCGKSLK